MRCVTCWLGMISLAATLVAQQPATAPASQPELTGVARLRQEASALVPLVKSELGKRFLGATAELPAIKARTLYIDQEKKMYISKAEYDGLSQEARGKVKVAERDEDFYYDTKYGSPLAYARPLELLAKAGFADVNGKRILDYGYGTVGHLRLLATLGADVVGVDVDPMLPLLYGEPGDQGEIKSRAGLRGRVTMVNGRWPAEAPAKESVGAKFDLIISKNTLKNGYLHPEQKVDPRMLVNLGVEEEAFVQALHDALNPGGLLLIFNICPARTPPGPKYIPWSDGRCPFSKELLEKSGFEVLVFDQDDTAAVQAQARALGWDKGPQPMDVEKDLYALYTLAKRK